MITISVLCQWYVSQETLLPIPLGIMHVAAHLSIERQRKYASNEQHKAKHPLAVRKYPIYIRITQFKCSLKIKVSL